MTTQPASHQWEIFLTSDRLGNVTAVRAVCTCGRKFPDHHVTVDTETGRRHERMVDARQDAILDALDHIRALDGRESARAELARSLAERKERESRGRRRG